MGKNVDAVEDLLTLSALVQDPENFRKNLEGIRRVLDVVRSGGSSRELSDGECCLVAEVRSILTKMA